VVTFATLLGDGANERHYLETSLSRFGPNTWEPFPAPALDDGLPLERWLYALMLDLEADFHGHLKLLHFGA